MPTWEQLQARVSYPLAQPMYVVRPVPPTTPPPDEDDEEEEEDSGSDGEGGGPALRAPPPPPCMRTGIMLRVFSMLEHKDLLVAMRVCRRWAQISIHPSLWKKISVHNKKITPQHVEGIVRRQPRSLSLDWCEMKPIHLSWLIERLPQLRSLSLQGNSWMWVSSLASPYCPPLSSLDISFCDGIRDTTLQVLLSAPRTHRPGHRDTTSRLRQLTSFSVAGTQITDDSMKVIVSALPFLTYLDLSSCTRITKEAPAVLAHPSSVLSHSLATLDLRGCHSMSPHCLPSLAKLPLLSKLLLHPCDRIPLKAIEVWGAHFGYSFDDDKVMTRLPKPPDLSAELSLGGSGRISSPEPEDNDKMDKENKVDDGETSINKQKEDKKVKPITAPEVKEKANAKEYSNKKDYSLLNVSIKLEKIKDPESLTKSVKSKDSEKSKMPLKINEKSKTGKCDTKSDNKDPIKLTLSRSKVTSSGSSSSSCSISSSSSSNSNSNSNSNEASNISMSPRSSKRRHSTADSESSHDTLTHGLDLNKSKDEEKTKEKSESTNDKSKSSNKETGSDEKLTNKDNLDSESACRRSERRSSGRRSKDGPDSKGESSVENEKVFSSKKEDKNVNENSSESLSDKSDVKKKVKRRNEEKTPIGTHTDDLEKSSNSSSSSLKGKMEKDIITRSKRQKEEKDAHLKKMSESDLKSNKKIKEKHEKLKIKIDSPEGKTHKPITLKRDTPPVKCYEKSDDGGPVIKIRMSEIKYASKLRKKSTDGDTAEGPVKDDKGEKTSESKKMRRRSIKDESSSEKSCDKESPNVSSKSDKVDVLNINTKLRKITDPEDFSFTVSKKKPKEGSYSLESSKKKKDGDENLVKRTKHDDASSSMTSSNKDSSPVTLSIKRLKEKDDPPITLSIKRGKDKHDSLTSTLKYNKEEFSSSSKSRKDELTVKQKEKEDSPLKFSIKKYKDESNPKSEDNPTSSKKDSEEPISVSIKRNKDKCETFSINLKRIKDQKDIKDHPSTSSSSPKKMKDETGSPLRSNSSKDESTSGSKKSKDSSDSDAIKLTRRPSESSIGSNSPSTKERSSSRERPERQHRSPRRLSMCQ